MPVQEVRGISMMEASPNVAFFVLFFISPPSSIRSRKRWGTYPTHCCQLKRVILASFLSLIEEREMYVQVLVLKVGTAHRTTRKALYRFTTTSTRTMIIKRKVRQSTRTDQSEVVNLLNEWRILLTLVLFSNVRFY